MGGRQIYPKAGGMMLVSCASCDRPYPATGVPYKCPACGGLYDFSTAPTFGTPDPSQPGIWRYASSFGFSAAPISLGEGNTPLVPAKTFGREVYFKCEYLNPTGSFKDRGSALLTAFLLSRGIKEAVEDSSGNAGASFAAYAARAGIHAKIFIPESASGPKRDQIAAYGAEVIAVPGVRSEAGEAALRAATHETVYASHAHLPFNIPGYATVAFEIYEQLGRVPGAVIVPVGQGGLLLGVARGFGALRVVGAVKHIPILVGIQAKACAPLWSRWKYGSHTTGSEKPSLAEGVHVCNPLRGDALISVMRENGGRFVSVDEAYILSGRDELASRGFYVEPTSALIWHVLEQILPDLPDPVVVLLTGSGLKTQYM